MTDRPVDPASDPDPARPSDGATWSAGATGSHAIDRELQRQLVGAALFATRAGPRIGRFAVTERLGAGASSVVYSAWDELLDRWVAIKLFVADSSATRDQVQREARALARLSHRNVVAVYDAGEWNGHAFIAMERILGTTLARWQAERKRPTAELLAAYLQAGRGLAAAHQAGLVHRDFKPANVMVAGDGRVVVADFGLVGGMAGDPGAAPGEPGSATTTQTPIGTPAYVAPEQRRGAAPHPSADVYSFSLALCEALIGWHPMRAPDAWSRALARRVPRRIHRAICAGLAAQPASRGDTMAALLDALTPRRRGQRTAALAVAGLAATTAAAAALRSGGGAAKPEPIAPPVFTAPSHRALARQIDAWRTTPPRPDAPGAAAALRALVLAPLPTELPCDWPAAPVSVTLGSDHAVGVDDRGRALACALDGGAVSPVTDDARCAVAGPDGLIGYVDRALHIQVVRATANGWQPVAATMPYTVLLTPPTPQLCPIVVLSERGGGARIAAPRWPTAVDRAARIAASASHDEVRLFDGAGRELSSRAIPSSPFAPQLAVSQDRALVVPLHGPLLWWQADPGQWREERVHFDTPALTRARLSPSGRRALLVNEIGGLEVRTLGGGRTAWLTSDPIRDAVFRDDDTVIAADLDNRLWRWDLPAQRSGVVAIHRGAVWSVATSPEVVASGSEDGTATVVDRATGGARLQLHPGTEIYRVVVDGDRVVTAGNDGLGRWDWRTGAQAPLADGRGLRIWDLLPATAGDGARIYLAGALADGAIFAWDAGERVAIAGGRPATRISDLALGPDGRTIAAVDSDGQLIVFDAVTRRPSFTVTAHRGWARHVAFDPVTATVVTIGDDGYLRSWAPPDRAARREVLVSPSHSAVYGLDVQLGRAVTASYDGSVARVDLASGEIVRRYRGHTSAVRTIRLRADGRWFATGDHAGRVCLWQIDDDECHTWLDGHRAAVLDVEFADDGTIFTASNNGVVRYWRPTYDQPIDALLRGLPRPARR
jgi:WD40 repeat protein/predicted Ser/Thr protein kinase